MTEDYAPVRAANKKNKVTELVDNDLYVTWNTWMATTLPVNPYIIIIVRNIFLNANIDSLNRQSVCSVHFINF